MEKQESKGRFPTFPQPRRLRTITTYGIRILRARSDQHKKVLIVEDNTGFRRLLRRAISHFASEVYEREDGTDALAAYRRYDPDWFSWISECHAWMVWRQRDKYGPGKCGYESNSPVGQRAETSDRVPGTDRLSERFGHGFIETPFVFRTFVTYG